MFSTIAFSVNFYLLDPEEIHLSEFASGVARLQGLFIVAKFRVAKSTGLAKFVTIAAESYSRWYCGYCLISSKIR